MALVKDAWEEEYDIVKGSIHPSKEALGYELAENLAYKGFCIIDSGVGFDELDIAAALDEAKDNLDTKFDPLPTEVVDGVLGDAGTARVAELCPPSRVGEDGANLGKLDSFMTGMLHSLTPYMSGKLGFISEQRTVGMVIQGGTASKTVPLTEKVCAKWLNTYLRQKLMVLVFLGPSEGTLELQPYDGQSAPEELATKPGMIVIFRSDVMGCEHFSTGENYTLGCYSLGPNLTGGRGVRNELKGLAPLNKNIEVLAQWAMNKTLDIKMKQVADGDLAVWSDDIPRGWERAMNHIYQTGYPVAVRGLACKEPIAHHPETFWTVLSTASDLVIEVPIARWDHSYVYDPEPESYRKTNFVDVFKTNVKHACFMDGLELFDAKLFNISPAESKGMDPQQRMVLETSYESLMGAGFTKKQLMNAYIGVFGGSTNPEWACVPVECGALAGTGCSEAIFCNRVSFCLGMQGPSTTIDCEMASSSCAIYVACAQVAPANKRHAMAGLDTPASLANGGYCMMVPGYWPRFNYWMNPVGRCLTYDESAAGYVRGESVGTLCIKPYLDTVDGQKVMSEEDCLGIPVGYRMNNNGKNTSMQAPSAPSEQECIFEILRQAKISYLDVDAVEGHGTGQLLHDAVEVGATSRALRGKVGGDKDALMINSVKTQVGAQCEACGITQAFRIIYSQKYGVNLQSLHLKTLNPHIEIDNSSVAMNTEMLSYRNRSSYHMQIARGFGGTNANITWWNKSDQERVPVERPSLQREVFAFWPAGGGALEFDAMPSQGYTIVGSWSDWSSAESMYQDSETSYSAVVTLGSGSCESFQIWIDGDPARVLHPGLVSAGSGESVMGPVEDSKGCCWTIDARSITYADGESYGAEGAPGDQYLVSLRVAGKWRAVTWYKVGFSEEDAKRATEGSYFLCFRSNKRKLKEMTPDPDKPGTHTYKVALTNAIEYFQILRNEDPNQVFSPPPGEQADSQACFGPEEVSDQYWRLYGKVGDEFDIIFTRTVEFGIDRKTISWTKAS